MNLRFIGLKPREKGDPKYADFWLEIMHLDTHISWEVPLTKAECDKLKPYLPKGALEEHDQD